MERELVKIASFAHSGGYYTQFKDAMKPGDVVYGAAIEATVDIEAMPPRKPKPAEPKPKKRKVRK